MSYQMTLQDSPRYLSGEYDYEVVGGDTVYYHNYPDVSSGNNLGSVASGGFLSRAVPSWVVSAGTSYIAQRQRSGTTSPSLVDPQDGAGSFYNAATRTFEMVTPTEAEGSPYDVRDYGATGDGTTDDTAAIRAAIGAAYNEGANDNLGNVFFPRGTYLITDRISVPAHINLIGDGGNRGNVSTGKGTTFKAGHADAQIMIGDGTSAGQLGSTTGYFAMDGNSIQDRAGGFLYLNFVVGRTFIDINVFNTVGDAVVHEQSQNNTHISLDIQFCGGSGLTLDQGAGGNAFLRCEVNTVDDYHLKIIETTGDGPYEVGPSHNHFNHCIFERADTAIPGVFLSSGGRRNSFDACSFYLSDDGSCADAVVQVAPDDEASDCQVILTNCQIASASTGATLIRQESGARVHLFGETYFNGTGTGWEYNGGTGNRNGFLDWPAGITRYDTSTGGAMDYNVPYRAEGALRLTADTTADTALARFYRSGETYARTTIDTGGGINIGNGSSGPDVSIGRIGVNTIGPGANDVFNVRGPFDHDGSTAGFFGTAPTTKPTVTGAHSSNAALQSLLTALANLGLITDSSS